MKGMYMDGNGSLFNFSEKDGYKYVGEFLKNLPHGKGVKE
jgi:hypothetical protein